MKLPIPNPYGHVLQKILNRLLALFNNRLRSLRRYLGNIVLRVILSIFSLLRIVLIGVLVGVVSLFSSFFGQNTHRSE